VKKSDTIKTSSSKKEKAKGRNGLRNNKAFGADGF